MLPTLIFSRPLLSIYYKTKIWSNLLTKQKAHTALAKEKGEQHTAYLELRNKFSSIYKKISDFDNSELTTPAWKEFNQQLAANALPYPSFDFLRDPTILLTMFFIAEGESLDEELKFLKANMSEDELKNVVKEDYIGRPLISNTSLLTSHNSIHHLHHIARFLKSTNCELSKLSTIVEWGGGYGNLCKILHRLTGIRHTYILIDTPIFCSLQWLYLSITLGKDRINMVTKKSDKIKKGFINILPIGLIEDFKFNGELFISTWALSESSAPSQDYVVKRNWFGAKHFLIGYQDKNSYFPAAGRLEGFMKEKGARIEAIPGLPGNHYAFK